MRRIRLQDVSASLRPCFGPALAEDPDFCAGVAEVLNSYSPWKEGFGEVSARMEEYLFNALYDRAGPGMTVLLADGIPRRIRTADLPAAADEALFPLFASLDVNLENRTRLQEYWMAAGSPAALRSLCLCFRSLFAEEDLAVLERIARETVPPDRLADWFQEERNSYR